MHFLKITDKCFCFSSCWYCPSTHFISWTCNQFLGCLFRSDIFIICHYMYFCFPSNPQCILKFTISPNFLSPLPPLPHSSLPSQLIWITGLTYANYFRSQAHFIFTRHHRRAPTVLIHLSSSIELSTFVYSIDYILNGLRLCHSTSGEAQWPGLHRHHQIGD